MKVSVQYAAEHFEDLVSAVQNGEAVEIACAGQPALRLVRSNASQPVARPGKRILGVGKAFTHLPSPEGLKRIDREWKREALEKRFGSAAE
jgi:antitoxin (DNA-binding transcriptional repressor) of toxin-antitoxin stability system